MANLLFPVIELLRPIPAVAWVPLAIMLWPTEHRVLCISPVLAPSFLLS